MMMNYRIQKKTAGTIFNYFHMYPSTKFLTCTSKIDYIVQIENTVHSALKSQISFVY